MPDEQKQDASATTAPAKPDAAPAKAAADEQVTISRAEFEKVQAALKAANAEAKSHREKAESEAAAKAAAEKQKLEAEGKWKEAFELERKQRDELAPKASRADKLEKIIASEVEALEQKLGDAAKSVAHLKQFAALAAGPAKATPTTAANPGAPVAQIDLEKASDAERRRYLESLPRHERRALLAQRTGNDMPVARFARVPKG
jgi:hypothetical protein